MTHYIFQLNKENYLAQGQTTYGNENMIYDESLSLNKYTQRAAHYKAYVKNARF